MIQQKLDLEVHEGTDGNYYVFLKNRFFFFFNQINFFFKKDYRCC